MSTEPVPRRHRRRERHRSRPAGPEVPPAGGGTPGEYGPPAGGSPAGAGPAETPAGAGAGGRKDPAAGGPAAADAPAARRSEPPADAETDAGGGGRSPGGGKARPGRRGDSERGLRGIVGSGPSQVGVAGAMRARDAARPTPEDLAAAERDLVIVRRHYVPPDADPRTS